MHKIGGSAQRASEVVLHASYTHLLQDVNNINILKDGWVSSDWTQIEVPNSHNVKNHMDCMFTVPFRSTTSLICKNTKGRVDINNYGS